MRTIIDPANRQTGTIKPLMLMDPMTFDPVPTMWTLNPMTRNPFGYRTRRETIMTGDPNIFMTIPSPVARDPNISGSRWRRGRFDNNSRRTDAHIDSGVRFRWIEKDAEDNQRQ
jgi:hypothetical protein